MSIKLSNEYPNSIKKGQNYQYKFWNNKPVLHFTDISASSSHLENLKDRQIYSSTNQLKLSTSLEWKIIDITNDLQMVDVVKFLNMYYRELTDFNIVYTVEYLRWALTSSGYILAINNKKTNKFCGIICANIKSLTIFDKTTETCNIQYLCADPAYRNKNISSVLIDEMTRILVHKNINVGSFITNRCVPAPISVIRQYYRPLNYRKLFNNKFIQLQDGKESTIKKFETIFNISLNDNARYVLMTDFDVKLALKLYNEYNARFNIYYNYDEQTFKQQFLNNEFVKTYSILDKENGVMVDFISFYVLPYTIKSSSETINAGYLLTYTCNTENTEDIIKNVLKLAVNLNLDLFYIYDMSTFGNTILTQELNNDEDSDAEIEMNKMFELKFLKTPIKVFFNLFNWQCPFIKSKQLNIIIN